MKIHACTRGLAAILLLGFVVFGAGCSKDSPTGPIVTGTAPSLDAHFDVSDPNGWSFVGTTDKAQVFVPGQSGRLTRVDVLIERPHSVTKALTVDVRNATSAGVPTEDDVNVLAKTTVAADAVPDTGYAWVKIDLSGANVMLTSGNFYAIVLRLEGNSGGDYGWRAATGNRYPAGDNYYRNPSISINNWALVGSGFDLLFRVYLLPVS